VTIGRFRLLQFRTRSGDPSPFSVASASPPPLQSAPRYVDELAALSMTTAMHRTDPIATGHQARRDVVGCARRADRRLATRAGCTRATT
jgi:hypothetical protein